jgi:hypothetical protein
MAGHPAWDGAVMTCMTGIVDGAIPSTDGYLTLRCPSELISLVDTSFRAFLCIASSNVNIETDRSIARTEVGTELRSSRDILHDILSSVLRRVYAPGRHAAKLIANAVDIEPNTARTYLDGRRVPKGDTLFELMTRCRELRDEIHRQANALDAACEASSQANNKTNNSVRSDNAEFRLRGHAQACVGCCQTWRQEGVALRPSIFLVDGWPGVRRDGGEREDAPARVRDIAQDCSGCHRRGDE